MAFVVVGHRPSSALLHRQTGLGAVERLDLALLIYREDDGVGGRIDIETDDVPELLDKLRVLRQFETSGSGAARVGELPGCVAPNAGSLRPPWQVPGPSSGCSRPAAAPRPDRPPAERCWAAAGAYQACASCRATALRRPPP